MLPHFDPAYRQLTVDDLLFNNNANVLIVDRESAEASEAAGRLMLRCAFRRPVMEAGGLGSVWESELVAWDDLAIDLEGQRIFAFDSEGEERRLIAERTQALAAAREAADQGLRDSLLAIATWRAADGDWKARSAAWQALKAQYEARDLVLPGEYEIDQRFRNIACGVASALAGRPVGYGFDKLIQVAHHLADNFPEALVPFGHALRSAGHQGVLKDQDRQGRWTRKAAGHRDGVRTGDPAYDISEELRALLRFVFPSLSAALT